MSITYCNFSSAGRALLAKLKLGICTRLTARYPFAPADLITQTAEEAIRLARKYNDCAALGDNVLDQAIRTTIRHQRLPYEEVLEMLGGRVDDDLHERIQSLFCRIADVIADEFAKPRAALVTIAKPKRRRPWPPRAGWWK